MIENVKEINDILSKHKMLVVHFSGSPKGSGVKRDNHHYPNDLKHVLAGNAQGGISCSTVKPGDCFSGLGRNATGCIGVIISLNNPQSVIDVSESDCGSIECANGERTTYSQKTLTISDIESSIVNRSVDRYNEWVVQNYNIIGILALSPFEISTFKKSPCPDGLPEHLWNDEPIAGIESLSVNEVISEFSGHQVFSFCNGEIVKIVNNQIEKVNHNELYV